MGKTLILSGPCGIFLLFQKKTFLKLRIYEGSERKPTNFDIHTNGAQGT